MPSLSSTCPTSILLASWIVYVTNFLSTRLSVRQPRLHTIPTWLQHRQHRFGGIVQLEDKAARRVCPLGRIIGWLLAGWVLLYNCVPSLRRFGRVNVAVWATVLLGSVLLNWNLLLYLLPAVAMQWYIGRTGYR